MKPDRSCTGNRIGRRGRLAGLGVLTIVTLVLAGCGGDDSSSVGVSSLAQATTSRQASPQQAADGATPSANQPYVDPVAYSMNATDGLDPTQVAEKAAVMHYTWKSGGTTVNYTTTTGHLTAADAQGNPEASMSYVAYTAPSTNGKPRPVTFVYNGGPGSSSIWLRLGSFAPTRVATPDPLFGTNWPNYPLVDNQESLIDTTDLVFIDPPGTGLSEAVLPNTNQKFWSSDADVNIMRDFIQRYLAVNNRSSSPIYLYGESYGTPRTDMLALALESAGVHLTGIVLQSSILNYFADAIEAVAITQSTEGLLLDTDTVAGYLPGYAAVAAYFNQVSPAPVNQGLYALQTELFTTLIYQQLKKYSQSWVLSQLGIPDALGTPVFPSDATLRLWSLPSGLTQQALRGYFNANPFGTSLLPGTTIGRYDGRVSLPNSDPRLQTDGDPSDILISQPFTNALATQLPAYLGYSAPNATYVPLNDSIIEVWDFSHDGQPMPDTIPDLLGALQLNPQLQVLAENGYHDLATPFFSTEKELARLQTVKGLNPKLQVNFFQGGHMIYLDDVARPQMKRDLKRFYQGSRIPTALTLRMLPPPWPDQSPAGTPTGSTPGSGAATAVAAAL
ncbi:S10 family serine carboxypeptidase-like protein [Burkholderia multivorans]|jgi:carboxypeptidase C (cathepsin A)|uniref:S10 family serine carboxypeptidase-like protein n=1 Tax=Burkholderia multivorans TaxID=87883 RepID=UPI00057DE768|nr:peptidase S10 [Burkholderia multivorans]KHS15674.1 peptidase S10 [Burkholderia multivorans]KHS18908.1 peptidase S10 [Burkholderia multivorans]MBR7920941.1 peptidase S10 [Burkholderia multivorans]MBR8102331.1 peptidase S10 [Burkholderia multivorans]MBR8337442.1 peptidase S10 [Burkholderia multivorans]